MKVRVRNTETGVEFGLDADAFAHGHASHRIGMAIHENPFTQAGSDSWNSWYCGYRAAELSSRSDQSIEALRKLNVEASGLAGAFGAEIRECVGNTNMAALKQRIAEAEAVLEGVVERQERSNCAECSATAYDHDHGGHFAECSQYTPPSALKTGMTGGQFPGEIYVTFEGGLYVGVFQDEAAAERLNAVRREKRGVDPVTVRYVAAPRLSGAPVGRSGRQ